MYQNIVIGMLLSVVAMIPTAPVHAGPPSKIVVETAEYLLKKFGKTAVTSGIEPLTTRLAKLAAQHGDDALLLVRKTGPVGLHALEQAGAKAPVLIRWVNMYGDDAAFMIRHPSRVQLALQYGDEAAGVLARHSHVAKRLITQQGSAAIRPLQSLSSRHARQLVMLAEDQSLSRMGRFHEILEVVGKYGDRAMEFIWKHRGVLVSATLLTAFVKNPEPYLNGTVQLVKAGGKVIVEPFTAAGREIGKNTNGTVVLSIVAVCTSLLLGLWIWLPRFLAYRLKARATPIASNDVETTPKPLSVQNTELVETIRVAHSSTQVQT